jgi:hypothetical protein
VIVRVEESEARSFGRPSIAAGAMLVVCERLLGSARGGKVNSEVMVLW